MKKLTPADIGRARDFLFAQARPLEKAVFSVEFEGGTVDEIFIELKKFQNPDGGFGKALEPDLRAPTSSALCTEVGLRHLVEGGASYDHPMVKAAVSYLFDTFDPVAQVWRVIPVDANDYPHAPWWHDEDGSLSRTFDDYLVIPRAGILACLYHYAELVPVEWQGAVTERTVSAIEGLETEQFGGGGDTLVYALRLADSPALEAGFKSRLNPLLRQVADEIVTRDPQAWSSYSTPALKLAPTPESPIADLLADEIQIYLDYLIDQQTSEGTWEPTWNWGENYLDEWSQAKEEWRGILTLDTLIALRAFGRLAG